MRNALKQEPIAVLSSGTIGLQTGGPPIRFIVQIFLFSALAVLIVHLFLDARLTLVQLAAHAIFLSFIYTLGFATAYAAVSMFWPRTLPMKLPASAFIWTVGALSVVIGLAIARGLEIISGGAGDMVHAHSEANLFPRLIPIWAIIVVLLIQNEKRRQLLLALRSNSALKPDNSAGGEEPDETSADAIKLQSGQAEFTLRAENIAFVAAEGNYCSIHFKNGKDRAPLMVRSTFSNIIDMLPPENFVQIHRSYIVNADSVNKVDLSANGGCLVLTNAARLPISRARIGEIRTRFGSLR